MGEVTGLAWDDVNCADRSVYFRSAKSYEDRFIPVEDPAILDMLKRLRAKTRIDGGPFVAYSNRSDLAKKWDRIIAKADIPYLPRHDLRRTGITRALPANVPAVTVQRLA